MAFSSQSFKAPKIKKGNFSSPLSSGAVKSSTSAPKLKATKISFIKKENSPIVEAVNNNAESLTQTNEILIEIQKQLAFDFANRIAEEKDAIKRIKAEESRRRFGEEEKAVEGTNKIKKGLFGAFDKVMAPAKGIFDKLLDFFSIILTGFIANKAFDWLKNKENRDKITGILNWIGENWKLLTGLFVVGKLLGPIGLLIKFGRLLAKLFKRGGGLGPDRLKRAKNLSGDCGSLLKSLARCIKGGLGKAFITAVAGGLIAGGYQFSKIPKGADKPVEEGKPEKTPNPLPNLIPALQTAVQDRFNIIADGFLNPKPLSEITGLPISEDMEMAISNALMLTPGGAAAGGLKLTPPLLSRLPQLMNAFRSTMPKMPNLRAFRRLNPFRKSQVMGKRRRILEKRAIRDFKELENYMQALIDAGIDGAFETNLGTKNPAVLKRLLEPNKDNVVQLFKGKNPRILSRVKDIDNDQKFGALLAAPLIPFILPEIKSQQTPKPAPVATQTVSIDAVDRNNMYRRTTPNIYGMGVFAF